MPEPRGNRKRWPIKGYRPTRRAGAQRERLMPREPRSKEPDHPGMASVIEYDNAATSGHPDDPVPECPNSRSAAADTKRAALKAAGAMSLSKKIDPETKVSSARASAARSPA